MASRSCITGHPYWIDWRKRCGQRSINPSPFSDIASARWSRSNWRARCDAASGRHPYGWACPDAPRPPGAKPSWNGSTVPTTTLSMLENREFLDLVLPSLRADFHLAGACTFSSRPERSHRVAATVGDASLSRDIGG